MSTCEALFWTIHENLTKLIISFLFSLLAVSPVIIVKEDGTIKGKVELASTKLDKLPPLETNEVEVDVHQPQDEVEQKEVVTRILDNLRDNFADEYQLHIK